MFRALLRIAPIALLVCSCVGVISDRESEGSTRSSGERPDFVGGSTPRCEDQGSSIGRDSLRRLTQSQYRNTVLELIGVEALPASVDSRLGDLPDGNEAGFAANADAPAQESLRAYLDMALAIAPLAPVDCDVSTSGCARDALSDFAGRAFRRPVDDVEVDDYVGMFETLRDAEGDRGALDTAFASILTSPSFLYHAEPIAGESSGEGIPLDGNALANRLAYFLWNSPPDAALRELAAVGALTDIGTLETEARRLMADPRFERHLENFYGQWLHADEVHDLIRTDAEWTPELQDALFDESWRFPAAVMAGDGLLSTLFSASFTVGDETLAQHYGAAPPDGSGRIDLPAERAGIITQAATLASLGTVFPEIHRGAWVRANLLCDPAPPPPADLVLDGSVRRLETEPCATCHRMMDPIGRAFDAFDSIGRHDPTVGSPPGEIIDVAGTLEPGLAGEFAGAAELAERLGQSERVHACVSLQWFRYALQRPEVEADACAAAEIRNRFTNRGGDLRELMVAIVRSEPFRMRAVSVLGSGGET